MKAKKCFWTLLFALIFSFMLVCTNKESAVIEVSAAKTNDEIKDEIDSLENRLTNASDELTALKKSINQSKSESVSLTNEITNIKHEIDLIDEQIIIMDALVIQYDEQTALLETEIAEYEEKLEKEKSVLNDMLRMSFECSGTGSELEFIFGADDFNDLITRVDLLAYHLEYNDQIIDNYTQSLNDLETKKNEYIEAKQAIEVIMSSRIELKSELEDKQSLINTKITALGNKEAQDRKLLEEKQKYIDELDAEIKRLAEALRKEDQSTYSGVFTFPLPKSSNYRITSYYGYRKDPFTKKTAYHSGYDFACAKGTDIYAADSGTVVIAYTNGGYGKCVTINHGGGVMTLYGHCSELLVKSGDKVSKGQVIAKVGSTGRSTGNHLHFEVRLHGELADPAPYIGLK